MSRTPSPAEALSDFEKSDFTHFGRTRTIYRRGHGPAVIIIAEMPGITPKVLKFAREVSDIGCTAVLPSLFGIDGLDPDNAGPAELGKMVASLVPICISSEFTTLASGKSSPVVSWLRALAAHEHARCGGPGVGAIGMCFTGGFALAMATDERLLAPVVAQPSLPVRPIQGFAGNIDISPEELETVKGRCAKGLQVLGVRFKGDRFSPPQRFEFLRKQLGDAFVAIELDDSSAGPSPIPPHSPLTEHLIDEPGQPTRQALDDVLDLFRRRLLTESI
ncbi:dienelactone hydrolase family protein [Nocardia sp. 348MFTsu5.1]|uniref:dienelactone hydrolase family protein n=1 Tax=Nocardia sp. 348MFTsu5.1 TaxID=1172185 RepID=UPI0003821D17|nr:dienelactone hydrolase family protein [Nocardia sp. 348MFTsu5.1]